MTQYIVIYGIQQEILTVMILEPLPPKRVARLKRVGGFSTDLKEDLRRKGF